MSSSRKGTTQVPQLKVRVGDDKLSSVLEISHEQLLNSQKLFMDVLRCFHCVLGTRFQVPVLGGKELDLHQFYVQVTKRGGFQRVIERKRWREIGNILKFPGTATSSSYALKKHYSNILIHFEDFYFHKKQLPFVATTAGTSEMPAQTLPNTAEKPVNVESGSSSMQKEPQQSQTEPQPEKTGGSEFPDIPGVIDGKFEHGYLVSVRINGEILRGVLYEPKEETVVESSVQAADQAIVPYQDIDDVTPLDYQTNDDAPHDYQTSDRFTLDINQTPSDYVALDINQPTDAVVTADAVVAYQGQGSAQGGNRKRRHRDQDPDRPKHNRSGYNFFFAEKHATLKTICGKSQREFTKIIGDAWNRLTAAEKMVYQKIGAADKERYRQELKEYKAKKRAAGVGTSSC